MPPPMSEPGLPLNAGHEGRRVATGNRGARGLFTGPPERADKLSVRCLHKCAAPLGQASGIERAGRSSTSGSHGTAFGHNPLRQVEP
jgi:hypothetical protein